MKRSLLAAMAVSALLAACQNSPTLETRTFALEYLDPYEAEALIDPYVYGQREGAPGTLSASTRALTVRETPDNLDQIARVLVEYDVPRPFVRLHFQLIEADGFTERDPRIQDVEEELRRLFQFSGYRLVGEAFVSAAARSEVQQGMGGEYAVRAVMDFVGAGTIRLQEVQLLSNREGPLLTTTVNVRPGQTLVLGTASRMGQETTMMMTVTAEVEGG